MRTVVAIAEAVRRGDLRATDVLDEALRAIERDDTALNAFVHVAPDLARRDAEAVDAAVARGEDPGALAGVPFAVKDNENCAGMPTAYGSLLYLGGPAMQEDGIHVARLRAAGAVPVGKTAEPEFGLRAYTSTAAHGTTRNPWNLERTPGGSSGGTSAAVSAGMVPFGTGSDGGGSIRTPAGFTGTVGLKASHGRIPLGGFSEFNVRGQITTSVLDAARLLDVTAGPYGRDPLSLPPPAVHYERCAEELDVRGLRAGWTPDLGYAVADPDVLDVAHAAAMTLVDAAALALVDRRIELPNVYGGWYPLFMGPMRGMLEQSGDWPARAGELDLATRIIVEESVGIDDAQVARAKLLRDKLIVEVATVFEDVDVLLMPTSAVTAFRAEGPMPCTIAGRSARLSGPVPYCAFTNVTGNPSISVPAGLAPDGLPVGLHVVGPRHADEVVLRLARILELARPWPRHAPSLDGVPVPAAVPVTDADVEEARRVIRALLALSRPG